ncbi:MAG: ferritin [Bacteroidota bacterium]|jgi:ferritin
MLSKAIQDAINEQIKNEMFSSYLYLSMATYCEEANLPGFAQWLRVQSNEENEHAMKFYSYVHDQRGHVELHAIEKPATKFKSPKDVFTHVLEHEQKVTAMITKLYELALKGKDYPTQILLQWFITEQVEEERNAAAIIEKLDVVGEHGPALLMLDREMGSRKGD